MELSDISVQAKVLAFLQRCAGAELVEDVIVTFRQWLENNAGTLQEISSNPCSDDLLFSVEENLREKIYMQLTTIARSTNLDILAESRGIVIACSFRITKRLQNGISSQYLALDLT